MKTIVTMMTMMMMIPRGWRLASIGPCKAYRKQLSPRRAWGPLRGRKASPTMGAKKRHHPAAHAATRPLPPPRVEPFLRRNPFQRPAQAVRSKPRRRGR